MPTQALITLKPGTRRRAFRQPVLALLMLAACHAWAASDDQPLGCLIQPDQMAEVGSPVIGLLEKVLVDRGDNVRKGQVLATLQADVEKASVVVARSRAEAEADVQAAKVELDYARQRLSRSEDLRRQNFISAQALDQNRAEVKVAEQKLAQSEEQRRIWDQEFRLAQAHAGQRVIRSPFSGVVVERYRYPGERVEEKPIIKLASLDPLRVEVFMPASRYGSINQGMALRVMPELPGAEPRDARVIRVDRVIDPASNTFRVQLRLPNPKQALPAGLRCKVTLDDGLQKQANAATATRLH